MTLSLKGKPFLVRFCVLGIFAFFIGRGFGAVSAETVHRIRLSQAPKVVVWEDDQAARSGALITLSKPGDVPGDTRRPLAGVVEPLSISEGPQLRSRSFRVATNTPFSIRIDSGGETGHGSSGLELQISHVSSNALRPEFVHEVTSAGEDIFRVMGKTAGRRGKPYSQSVEFTLNFPETMGSRPDITIVAGN